jgi:hypothetical protein
MDIKEVTRTLRSGGKIPLSYGGEEFYLSGSKPAWHGEDNITVNGLKSDDLYLEFAKKNEDMELPVNNERGFIKAYKEENKRFDREIAAIATEKKIADKRINKRRKRLVSYLVKSGVEPRKILTGKIDMLTRNAVDLVEGDRSLRTSYGSNGKGYRPEDILAPVMGDLKYVRRHYGEYFIIKAK